MRMNVRWQCRLISLFIVQLNMVGSRMYTIIVLKTSLAND